MDTAITSPGPLAGKVALITGGSGGMGTACARLLVEQGAAVALLARQKGQLDAAAESLLEGARGAAVLPVVADVGDTQSAAAAVREVHARYGRIDMLLNFAGYNLDYPAISRARPSIEQITNLERIVNVDMLGTARMVFLVEPIMRAQRCGSILTIGNTPTLHTSAEDLIYQVAKAGNKKLTEAVACQHRQDGFADLRIYFLAPHFVYNPSTFEGMSPEQRRAADQDGWLDSDQHIAPIVSWLLCGRLRRDSGSTVLLGPQTAPALFAEVNVAYPAFSPPAARSR